MKINNLRGDLTDISAKKEALVPGGVVSVVSVQLANKRFSNEQYH